MFLGTNHSFGTLVLEKMSTYLFTEEKLEFNPQNARLAADWAAGLVENSLQ